MDIQHLVDRLEDLIDEGRHIFGTRYTLIDEERALEIIDQMRISIPEEIEKAARVLAQRDSVLAEAHEEAARIVRSHRERAEQMLDENHTVQQAKTRAEAIKEQARQEAQRITDEADSYALQVLNTLEQQLIKDLNAVRNGISVLQTQPPPIGSAAADTQQQHGPVHIPNQQYADELVDADVTVDADYAAYNDPDRNSGNQE